VYHGMKSSSSSLKPHEKRYHYRQMLCEKTDASLVMMLEAFLEAAPQLVLQLYIILTEDKTEDELCLSKSLCLYSCIAPCMLLLVVVASLPSVISHLQFSH